jgi:hypothetical protein
MTEAEELCAGFNVGRKERQQKDVATEQLSPPDIKNAL